MTLEQENAALRRLRRLADDGNDLPPMLISDLRELLTAFDELRKFVGGKRWTTTAIANVEREASELKAYFDVADAKSRLREVEEVARELKTVLEDIAFETHWRDNLSLVKEAGGALARAEKAGIK